MLVRFIGGPADGQVNNVETFTVRFRKLPVFCAEKPINYIEPEIATYNVHKLLGEKKVFYIACEGSVDEALERLLFKELNENTTYR